MPGNITQEALHCPQCHAPGPLMLHSGAIISNGDEGSATATGLGTLETEEMQWKCADTGKTDYTRRRPLLVVECLGECARQGFTWTRCRSLCKTPAAAGVSMGQVFTAKGGLMLLDP